MSWGKEWSIKCQDDPKGDIDFGLMKLEKLQPKTPWIKPVTPEEQLKVEEAYIAYIKGLPDGVWDVGWDLGSGDQTVTAIIKDGQIEKVYNNLSPTHDPYTNPNSHIYYQCKCGDILDPGTKSFAALNNCASEKGWKVRWSKDGQGYEPFCVECGEGVE